METVAREVTLQVELRLSVVPLTKCDIDLATRWYPRGVENREFPGCVDGLAVVPEFTDAVSSSSRLRVGDQGPANTEKS